MDFIEPGAGHAVRVEIGQPHEEEFWCVALAVSPAQLREAIRMSDGTLPGVCEYLEANNF